MNSLLAFLRNTPIYVYFIFVYLLTIGFKASKERCISYYTIFILPCIFLYLSVTNLVKVDLPPSFITLFVAVLLTSALFGWSLVAKKKIQIFRAKKQLVLPGSWMTLGLVLLIFASKYYLGYKKYVDPQFIISLQSKLITIFTSGFSLGLIFGRSVNYLYRIKK